MSGDWIKMGLGLPDKPEVWQIAGMLGIDPDAVVGKLLRVWGWFDTHTTDGNAYGVTYALIDRIAGVAGFAEAMAFAGWLEQRDRILSCPNFSRHNGKTAKQRALTNDRVAKHRASGNAGSNDDTVTKSVTREEKRREEINTSVPNGTGVPPEVGEQIFALGVPLLTAANVSDRNARSMLGLMRKTHGDAAVLDALQRCAETRPIEPVAWLQASLKRAPPRSAESARDRAARERMEAFAPSAAVKVGKVAEVIDVVARRLG